MAGGAVGTVAASLRAQIVALGARLLEADPVDVTICDGIVQVVGVPSRGVPLATIAQEARRTTPPADRFAPSSRKDDEALRLRAGWNGGEGGWAQSTHVCWVDVDLETGMVRIPRYLVVEDCGDVINPAIVEGQIRGGVAQGVGAVLYESINYDDHAQIHSGTFMDYLLPTMAEVPSIEVHHISTPSDIAYNIRGVGEGGMIGAPAAITSAIEDALADLGVRVTQQHLPPTRILELARVIAPD
jgi:carbon-monoxide dehydrogenase large subunit